MKNENRRFAKESILAIEELAEQLADELKMDDIDEQENPIKEDATEMKPIEEDESGEDMGSLIDAAEKMLSATELPDEKDIVSKQDDEAEQVLAEAEELENQINAEEEAEKVSAEADELEKQLDACEKQAEVCPNCQKENCECGKEGKTASETTPGIEDEIGDEANGGDPSVSSLPDTKIDCDTDKEVFGQGTDSEYVARITARLDRVANALEKRGMKRMAFRIDQLSDKLEASIR